MKNWDEVVAEARELGLKERFKCSGCGTPFEVKYRSSQALEAIDEIAAQRDAALARVKDLEQELAKK